MMPGISQDSTGKSALENFAHWLTQSTAYDITRVVRKVKRDSGWEMIQKVRFYIKDKRVSLNQSMTGIEDMDVYLMRHVDAKKITTKK